MKRLEIVSEMIDAGIHLIKPRGKLDVFSFVELRVFLEDLALKEKALHIVVDLAAVEYVSSSGWSVLLSRRKILRLSGGDLCICCLTSEMQRVYNSMNIEKLLPAAASTAGAVQLLRVATVS